MKDKGRVCGVGSTAIFTPPKPCCCTPFVRIRPFACSAPKGQPARPETVTATAAVARTSATVANHFIAVSSWSRVVAASAVASSHSILA